MDRESARLIRELTGMKLRLKREDEKVDMCKAIDDMIADAVREKDKAIADKDKAIREAAKDKADAVRKEQDEAFLAQSGIIRNIMQRLSMSAEEAMNVAGIQAEKRGRILAMLQ